MHDSPLNWSCARRILRCMGTVLVCLLVLSSQAVSAQTTTQAFTLPTNPSGAEGCQDIATCGFAFQVTSQIDVVALGVTYVFANNKAQSAQIGIWNDITGELLSSASIANSSSGTLVGDHRFIDISPVTLSPGTRYVIGSRFSGPDLLFSDGPTPAEFAGAIAFAPEIAPIEGRFLISSTFERPIFSNGGASSRLNLGPNLLFELAGPSGDLDIESLRVAGPLLGGTPCSPKLVRMNLTLGVVNSGTVEESSVATVVGVQSGAEVYRQSQTVSAPVGGDRVNWQFPPFFRSASSSIQWTVTIADDDPDVDVFRRITNFLGNPNCP